jgi:hypothetical protein
MYTQKVGLIFGGNPAKDKPHGLPLSLGGMLGLGNGAPEWFRSIPRVSKRGRAFAVNAFIPPICRPHLPRAKCSHEHLLVSDSHPALTPNEFKKATKVPTRMA